MNRSKLVNLVQMEKGNFAELEFRDVAEKLNFAKNFQINKEVVLELALKMLILHSHILL